MGFKKIVIIGVGLIGGSAGKAIKKNLKGTEVVGVFRREVSLEKALTNLCVDKGYLNDYKKALNNADLAIIAVPVHMFKDIFKEVVFAAEDGLLVTDACSTKQAIVEYADTFSDKVRFVGAHPLAGSEKTGSEHSSGDLFKSSKCIITPSSKTEKEACSKVSDFWGALGADIIVMNTDEHDKKLAYASHLPHIAAYGLSSTLDVAEISDIISTGFKDTTRIAKSDPGLWTGIFMDNKYMVDSIDMYIKKLKELKQFIKTSDDDAMKTELTRIINMREEVDG